MLYRYSAATLSLGVAVFLLSALPHRTSAASIPVNSPRNDAAADKFVHDALRVWQDRMNLKDWDIHIQLVRADKLEPKTLGNIHWDTDVKQATIDVLAPEDYQMPYNAMLADMEVTVVHELVHLELSSLPRSDESRRVEEHAVNQIAAALLKLARR
jgi:hypothetical protein